MPRKVELRTENDSEGSTSVPVSAYWGAHTARALESAVKISDLNPRFLEAALLLHKAAALTAQEDSLLEAAAARSICQAVDETLFGQWQNQFVVNLMQAAAVSNFILNVREFLANRAGEIMGSTPGTYKLLQPDLHAGLKRSHFQDFAVSLRIALVYLAKDLDLNLKDMERLLRRKAAEFDRGSRAGNTDKYAVETDLSTLFNGFGFEIGKLCRSLSSASERLLEIPLFLESGTANGDLDTQKKIIDKLSRLCNLPLKPICSQGSIHLILTDYVSFSAELNLLALTIQRLSADLCLLSKAKEIGFSGATDKSAEENNILDFVAAVSCQVMGGDSICKSVSQQVQLNANTKISIIAHNLLLNMDLLRQTVSIFNRRCIYNMTSESQKSISADFRAVSTVS